MSPQPSKTEPEVASDTGGITRAWLYSKATRLARRGGYQAAEDLLRRIPEDGPDLPSRLDLLARIRAQQGAMREAEQLWRRVLVLKPNDPPAMIALEHLKASRRSSFNLESVGRIAGFFAVAGLIFLAIRPVPPRATSEMERISADAIRLAREQFGRQEERLRALGEQIAQLASSSSNLTATVRAQKPLEEQLPQLNDRVKTIQTEADLARERHSKIETEQIAETKLTRAEHATLAAGLAEWRGLNEAIQADLKKSLKGIQTQTEEAREGQLRNGAEQRASEALARMERAELAGGLAELRQIAQDLKARLDSYAPNAGATNQIPTRATPPVEQRAVSATATPQMRRLLALLTEVPGVRAELRETNLLVTFEKPLFRQRDWFAEGARATLASAARAIAKAQTQIELEIVGFEATEPPVWPWSRPLSADDLRQSRARKVSDYLKTLDILPSDAVKIAGESAQLPHDQNVTVQSALSKAAVLIIRTRVNSKYQEP